MDYWETVLTDIPESYRMWFEREREYLQMVIPKNSFVLEVGCGDGRSILDIISVTEHIVGIDHDSTAVASAKEKFKAYEDVNIIQADAQQLPFENGIFDAVICMTTFANLGDARPQILSEIKRVMKPSGIFVISVFSEDALEERMKVYERVSVEIKSVDVRGKVVFDESIGANVSEQFTQEELEHIFQSVGFTIDNIEKVGIAYICSCKVRE